jgi:hypothetical protein
MVPSALAVCQHQDSFNGATCFGTIPFIQGAHNLKNNGVVGLVRVVPLQAPAAHSRGHGIYTHFEALQSDEGWVGSVRRLVKAVPLTVLLMSWSSGL